MSDSSLGAEEDDPSRERRRGGGESTDGAQLYGPADKPPAAPSYPKPEPSEPTPAPAPSGSAVRPSRFPGDQRYFWRYEVVIIMVGVVVAFVAAAGSVAVVVWAELRPDPPYTGVPQLPTVDGRVGQPLGEIANRCADSADNRAGWGPDRPMIGGQTQLSWPGFNADRDNPNIGDERGFVGSREVGSNGPWQDEVRVEHGKRYRIRVYIRNNAYDLPETVATDTTVRLALPDCEGVHLAVNAYVRSPDAFPFEIWDGVNFYADKAFRLSYVADSAVLESNGFPGPPPGNWIGGNDFLSQPGQLVGFDRLDGRVRGGYYYGMYFSLDVEVAMR